MAESQNWGMEVIPKSSPASSSPSVLIGDPDLFALLQDTSASIILCANADPDARRDLEMLLSRLAPEWDPDYVHEAEGTDDMASKVHG